MTTVLMTGLHEHSWGWTLASLGFQPFWKVCLPLDLPAHVQNVVLSKYDLHLSQRKLCML